MATDAAIARLEGAGKILVIDDERTLREIYLPHFRKAVQKAKVASFMTSYNQVNGTYASENGHLLQDILKGEWGFEGIVISDWGGTYSTVDAANNGLDLEMPGPARLMGDKLLQAVRSAAMHDLFHRIDGRHLSNNRPNSTIESG